jgi:hypothetical protein
MDKTTGTLDKTTGINKDKQTGHQGHPTTGINGNKPNGHPRGKTTGIKTAKAIVINLQLQISKGTQHFNQSTREKKGKDRPREQAVDAAGQIRIRQHLLGSHNVDLVKQKDAFPTITRPTVATKIFHKTPHYPEEVDVLREGTPPIHNSHALSEHFPTTQGMHNVQASEEKPATKYPRNDHQPYLYPSFSMSTGTTFHSGHS